MQTGSEQKKLEKQSKPTLLLFKQGNEDKGWSSLAKQFVSLVCTLPCSWNHTPGISLVPGPTCFTMQLFTVQCWVKGPNDQSNSHFPAQKNLTIGHAINQRPSEGAFSVQKRCSGIRHPCKLLLYYFYWNKIFNHMLIFIVLMHVFSKLLFWRTLIFAILNIDNRMVYVLSCPFKWNVPFSIKSK